MRRSPEHRKQFVPMGGAPAGSTVPSDAIFENGGEAMAVTDSTASGQQGIDPELAVRDVIERLRNAYDRRDVDGALELFADDAVLVFAPRAFKGKGDIRHGLEWDAQLSPTSETRLSGIEVLARANVAVMESVVVQQTADGIGYECPVVTVIELGDDRKIRRMSSYYDRLAIVQQVANKSSGLRGAAFKRLANALVSQAEKGLERPEVPRENVQIVLRWLREGIPTSRNLGDAIRLAGVIVTGVLSRRPVRPVDDEARRPLPGDELVSTNLQYTDCVTIRARPSEIWPWLVQMGCRRAGWYSYDRLDNGGVPSADRILPELQRVEVGDILRWTPDGPDDGFVVLAVEPERALVLGDDRGSITWAFVLEPIDKTSTRLVTRGKVWYKRPAVGLMVRLVLRPIYFGMQRRQLLSLKQRVEAGTR